MDSEEARARFISETQSSDEEIDLARAALLIAATEYPDLDLDQELAVLDSLAAGASRRLGDERDPLFTVNSLNEYLFDEMGFRGNQEDYYDPRNSFLNELLSRRLGIPITLSLLYIEVAKRLEVPLVGVGMPGHFLVRHLDVDDIFIDPFYGGVLLSEDECSQRLRQVVQAQVAWDPRYLAPIGNREFVARMLRNLKAIYLQRHKDLSRGLATINWILSIEPRSPPELRDRGLVHFRLGHHAQALVDLEDYLATTADGPGVEVIRDMTGQLRRLLSN